MIVDEESGISSKLLTGLSRKVSIGEGGQVSVINVYQQDKDH